MNERIRELAEEAKFYADENHAHYVMNPHWINTFEEKFAKLIVQECAMTIQDFVDHRIPASEYPARLRAQLETNAMKNVNVESDTDAEQKAIHALVDRRIADIADEFFTLTPDHQELRLYTEYIAKYCAQICRNVGSDQVDNASKDYQVGREMAAEVCRNQIRKEFGVA